MKHSLPIILIFFQAAIFYCLNFPAIIGVVEHVREHISDGYGPEPKPWHSSTVTHRIKVIEDFKVTAH